MMQTNQNQQSGKKQFSKKQLKEIERFENLGASFLGFGPSGLEAFVNMVNYAFGCELLLKGIIKLLGKDKTRPKGCGHNLKELYNILDKEIQEEIKKQYEYLLSNPVQKYNVSNISIGIENLILQIQADGDYNYQFPYPNILNDLKDFDELLNEGASSYVNFRYSAEEEKITKIISNFYDNNNKSKHMYSYNGGYLFIIKGNEKLTLFLPFFYTFGKALHNTLKKMLDDLKK